MSGMPWMKLWIDDLDRDTTTLSLRARGAWVWILFELRRHGGSRSLTLSQWAQVVRSTETETALALREIIEQGICDSSVTQASRGDAKVTAGDVESDAKIDVTCRRIVREAKNRNLHNLRQNRYRARQQGDAAGDASGDVKVTGQKLEAIEAIEAEAVVCSSSFSGRRGDFRRPPEVAKASTTTTTRLPASAFVLTEELRQWAEAAAPDLDPESEAEKFVDHYARDGTTFADLPAAFRKWLRDSIERQKRAKSPARRLSVEENNRRVISEFEQMDETAIRIMQGLDPERRS